MSSDNGLSFNWDICWTCNYRCPYCWFFGQWDQLQPKSPIFQPGEILSAWERIRLRYGPARVAITGGEPFLYPGFTDIIAGLAEMHSVEIISNISSDIEAFVAACQGRDVVVNPSFHPLFADAEAFAQRALALKDKGMMRAVTMVAWPPLVRRIPEFQERFGKHGLRLTIQPFQGSIAAARYPESYTAEERRIINLDLGDRGGAPFRMEGLVTRGRICRAGQRYAVVHPDGTALRCGGGSSGERTVGNIMREDFSLWPAPRPCASDNCPCNEWAFLLEK